MLTPLAAMDGDDVCDGARDDVQPATAVTQTPAPISTCFRFTRCLSLAHSSNSSTVSQLSLSEVKSNHEDTFLNFLLHADEIPFTVDPHTLTELKFIDGG